MPKYLYIKTKKFPTTEEPNIPYIKFKKDNITTLANLGQMERFSSMDQLTEDISGIILHRDNEYIVIKPMNKKMVDLKEYCYLNAKRTDETIDTSYDDVYYGDYDAYIVDYDEITNIKVLPDASYAFSGYPALFKEDIPQEVIDSWDMSDVTCLESFFGAMYLGEGDNCDSREMGHNSEHLDLSNWNISKVENMNDMFYRALNLKTLNMPTCPMPKLKTMIRAFRETGLTELPLFDTSNVEDMTEAFCRNDNVIEFPLYDTGNVKDMTRTFYWNWRVTTTPQFDLSNVEIADGMFERCENLLSISQFNTPKLRSTQNMFYDCEKLVAEGLKSFDTSNVENMSSMFYNCQSLTTIPYFNTSKVKDVSWMFVYCYNLTSIPALDFSNVETMFKTFYCCSKLTNSGLPQLDTSKVTDMTYTFWGTGITELPNLVSTANVKSMWGTFYGTDLVHASLSKYNLDNVENMNSMFSNCKSLELAINIKMPSCLNTSGMFSNCTKLTQCQISPSTTSNILYAGSMFANSGITQIPQFNMSNISNIGGMFKNCINLSEILDPISTHSARNMSEMFYGCTKLPKTFPYEISCYSITKPDHIKDMFKNTNVTEITLKDVHISIKDKITSQLLKGNNTLKINFKDINEFHRNLKLMYEEEGIRNIYDNYATATYFSDHFDLRNVKSIKNLFSGCSNLIETPILENTSSIETMVYTFYGCSKLEKAPNIDSHNITDMYGAFSNCSSLNEIPTIDTSKCTVFDNMFEGCTSLPSVFPWTIDCSSLDISHYGYPPEDGSEPWGVTSMFENSSVTEVTFKNVPEKAKYYFTVENLKGEGEELKINIIN